MLKTRVIPLLLIKDGLLKKPIRFKNPRNIANPISIARVFEEREVDELIMLNIGCSAYDEDINTEIITEIAEELFVPFACGGGIKSIEGMLRVINSGAEKVVINTAAVDNPKLIEQGALKFGSQCIVVSIDAKKSDNGIYNVFTNNGTQRRKLDPVEWAKCVEREGAGEILINSINHDGVMSGFNIELIRSVANAVRIPVIAAGGAGRLDDFVEVVLKGHASAVAAGSIYYYTKITPNMVKEAMKKAGISVRN